MKIEVFGIGCENCQRLEDKVRRTVADLNIDADIEKVEDFEALIRRGIRSTPCLVINGKIVSQGRVPNEKEITSMLSEEGPKKTAKGSNEIMLMSAPCNCSFPGAKIYPCSGGCNVGQIANETAKLLVARGRGMFACLVGVSSYEGSFIANAKNANGVIVLDGCDSNCAYKTLRLAGVEPTVHVVVTTELGLKKDYDKIEPSPEYVSKFLSIVESKLPPSSDTKGAANAPAHRT
jgi:small redox-active disulfide protein 2